MELKLTIVVGVDLYKYVPPSVKAFLSTSANAVEYVTEQVAIHEADSEEIQTKTPFNLNSQSNVVPLFSNPIP